jgi:N,N'-diacetylbacillosaminyl-diphospho-undecaprenol alpha-1,3-N-acetylgalactosaminyltransferase
MAKIGFLSHLDANIYLFRLPIIKALIEKGHKVYIFCLDGFYSQEMKKMGLNVINYDIERGSLNPFKEIKAIKNIYLALKPYKLDILHTFTAKPNIYGVIAGRALKIPKIINLVEGLGSFYIENDIKSVLIRKIIELFYKITFKFSNLCIFVNEDDPKYLIEKNIISPKKVRIIKSVGIDTAFFCDDMDVLQKQRYKLSINIDPSKKVVLMIARVIKHKGILEYLEAARNIKSKREDVEFVLVGGLDEGNKFGIKKEILHEYDILWLKERTDIKELLSITDIFVLPSYYGEGVPRTLLEAASMAKPIITTNHTGCKEVVEDGKNGFLVPIKDYKTLAQKLEILIDNPDLREKFGKNSREKAKKEFDIKIIVDKYLKVYEEILDV